jgi:hypothetical protein
LELVVIANVAHPNVTPVKVLLPVVELGEILKGTPCVVSALPLATNWQHVSFSGWRTRCDLFTDGKTVPVFVLWEFEREPA